MNRRKKRWLGRGGSERGVEEKEEKGIAKGAATETEEKKAWRLVYTGRKVSWRNGVLIESGWSVVVKYVRAAVRVFDPRAISSLFSLDRFPPVHSDSFSPYRFVR